MRSVEITRPTPFALDSPIAVEVKGYDLRRPRDPAYEEILAGIGDPAQYSEVVFCGFGEPTLIRGERDMDSVLRAVRR